MNNKMINLLKDRSYSIPSYLIKHYKKLNITGDELIIIIYLINSNPLLEYKTMSDNLNIKVTDIMTTLSTLKDKKVIEIDLKKNINNKFEEYVNLDILYNKLFMILINEEKENSNIYSRFEKELGRTLSPYEYEVICNWLNNYKEDVILSALKEGILNGVTSLSYIDRILLDWYKKGLSNEKKYESVEVPDYDWLKDECDN